MIPLAHGCFAPPVQPDDIEALKSALIAVQLRADEAEAKLAGAQAHASAIEAAIAHLTLEIAKLKRERFGSSSERTARLLDQLEFQLAEHEETATEDEIKAEMASPKTTTVRSFTRKRPARREFPAHLPRERVVVAPPTSCH